VPNVVLSVTPVIASALNQAFSEEGEPFAKAKPPGPVDPVSVTARTVEAQQTNNKAVKATNFCMMELPRKKVEREIKSSWNMVGQSKSA
jgi:hypothetical protein